MSGMDETWAMSTQMWVLACAIAAVVLLWLTLVVLARRGYDVGRGWPIDRRSGEPKP